MDGERLKDFSAILYDMYGRQDLMSHTITWLATELESSKKVNSRLIAEVEHLRRIVALNNVLIAFKRDEKGEFEPLNIQTIVRELLKHASKV